MPPEIPREAKELEEYATRLELPIRTVCDTLFRRAQSEKRDPMLFDNALLMALLKVTLRRAVATDLLPKQIMHNIWIILVHTMAEAQQITMADYEQMVRHPPYVWKE